MADSEDPATAWTGVYFLRDYNPYRFQGQRNPAFKKATDGRLLDLKDNLDHGVTAAAEDFKTGLDKLNLPAGTILVIVPGHEAMESNAKRALARAAHALAQLDKRYVASVDSLIRTKTVPKKTGGGSRDIDVDLNSIVVSNSSSLKGTRTLALNGSRVRHPWRVQRDSKTAPGPVVDVGVDPTVRSGATQMECRSSCIEARIRNAVHGR